jgi:hypothetical protein
VKFSFSIFSGNRDGVSWENCHRLQVNLLWNFPLKFYEASQNLQLYENFYTFVDTKLTWKRFKLFQLRVLCMIKISTCKDFSFGFQLLNNLFDIWSEKFQELFAQYKFKYFLSILPLRELLDEIYSRLTTCEIWPLELNA